jgi:iron complex outermembrane recepter protein
MSPLGTHVLGAATDLAPEEQAGIDWGADLSFGRALTVRATRFDQRASGLIQAVGVGFGGPSGPGRGLRYQWQNVGDVTNRGWELETSANAGHLTLTGSLSLVESRVRSLASGYTGELVAGDRMLEVPRRVAGVSATWSSPGWSASTTLARASDWIGYDQLGIAEALGEASSLGIHAGTSFLRGFWSEYRGVTRLRASASRDLARGFSLTFTGDNLLGYQRGEPDNVTIVPGRALLFGIRARF